MEKSMKIRHFGFSWIFPYPYFSVECKFLFMALRLEVRDRQGYTGGMKFMNPTPTPQHPNPGG
jgi:hypothetical protein